MEQQFGLLNGASYLKKHEKWDTRKVELNHSVDPLIPESVEVTFFLRWINNGWNEIFHVSVSAGENSDNRTAIPYEFLKEVPKIVERAHSDIEGTRQAIQLLANESDLLSSPFGALGEYFTFDPKDKDVVAYRLKSHLKRMGVKDFEVTARDLLGVSAKSTYFRMCERGKRELDKRKKLNTNPKKGVKK